MNRALVRSGSLLVEGVTRVVSRPALFGVLSVFTLCGVLLTGVDIYAQELPSPTATGFDAGAYSDAGGNYIIDQITAWLPWVIIIMLIIVGLRKSKAVVNKA